MKIRRLAAFSAPAVLCFLLIVVIPTLAFAEEGSSPSGTPVQLSEAEVERLVGEMHQREEEAESNGEDVEGLPRTDLNREQAAQLLNAAFREQLEGAAGAFDSLSVDQFLSNTAAVVPAPGAVAGSVLLESNVPLRTDNEEGSLEPVDLSLESSSEALEPENALVEVEIPKELGDGVTLPEAEIGIELVGAPAERAPSIIDGTTSFYPNVAEDTDLSVAPTPFGVETFTQLRSPQSPTSQTFHLDLPAGAELQQVAQGGAQVVGFEGVILTVNPPLATDAAGASQPVEMNVAGDSLTLEVSPTSDAQYPILVDPTYLGDFYNWSSGSTSTAGWVTYRTSPSQLANSFTEPGYLCNQYSGPWCGIYVGAAAGSYGAGAQAGANYNVPRYEEDLSKFGSRPTTWIQEIYINPWGFWGSGEKTGSPAVLIGLWNETKKAWEGNTLLPVETTTPIDINAGSNHEAQNAIFNLYAWQPSTLTAYRYTNMGSAWLYLADEGKPQFGSVGSPGKWVNTAAVPFNLTVTDTGLGVSSLQVSTSGGTVIGTTSVKNGSSNCVGTAGNPCPRKWEGAQAGNLVNYNPTSLPQGANTLSITAADPLGNTEKTTLQVKVDHTAPSLALSGTLTEQEKLGTELPSYVLHINAEDGTTTSPQSGVASTEIKVDGTKVDSTSLGCSTENCKVSRDWTLNSSSYSDGAHKVEVTATDAAGIPATPKILNINIKADRTAPAVTLSGSMTEQATLGKTRPRYNLKLQATDTGGSGVVSTSTTVDGKVVDSTSPGCPTKACSITREWSLTSLSYSVGVHTVKVTATDKFNLITTKTLTIEVQRDTTSPQISTSGTFFNAPQGWVEQEPFQPTISATDTNGYGLTKLKFTIDGKTIGEVNASCPDGGCPASTSPAFNTSEYLGGAHAGEIVATDGAGNTAKKTWTINVDPEGHVSTSEAVDTLEAVESTSDEAPVASTSEIVEQVEIEAGNDPGLQDAGNVIESTGVPTTTVLNPSEDVVVEGSNGPLTLSPTEAGSTEGTIVEGVAAVTPNTDSGVDTITRPEFDGSTIFTAIREPGSSGEYSWSVSLNNGQTLRLADSQHAEVAWENGEVAFLITAEQAHDAVNVPVPTRLKVSGNTLTLVVELAGGSFVYPILAGQSVQTAYVAPTVIIPAITEPTPVNIVQGRPVPPGVAIQEETAQEAIEHVMPGFITADPVPAPSAPGSEATISGRAREVDAHVHQCGHSCDWWNARTFHMHFYQMRSSVEWNFEEWDPHCDVQQSFPFNLAYFTTTWNCGSVGEVLVAKGSGKHLTSYGHFTIEQWLWAHVPEGEVVAENAEYNFALQDWIYPSGFQQKHVRPWSGQPSG